MGAAGKAWLESFTTDEIRDLRAIREHRAWLTIIVNYGLIAASMALVAYAPNALTVVLALCIIGTRQLGLAVVMHESAHYTLFKNRRLNDFVGNWLAGYPIYLSADMYRAHHLEHHTKTWTEEDPDLGLANGFPVSKASMARKVMRDLLGITGLKQLIGTTYLVVKVVRGEQVDAGTLPLRLEREPALRMVVGTVVTNVVLVAVLWSLGQPMLYLLWLGAWLTTNKLVARIRSIAEHAVVAADDQQARRANPFDCGACRGSRSSRPPRPDADGPGRLARAAVRRAEPRPVSPRASSADDRAPLQFAEVP